MIESSATFYTPNFHLITSPNKTILFYLPISFFFVFLIYSTFFSLLVIFFNSFVLLSFLDFNFVFIKKINLNNILWGIKQTFF